VLLRYPPELHCPGKRWKLHLMRMAHGDVVKLALLLLDKDMPEAEWRGPHCLFIVYHCTCTHTSQRRSGGAHTVCP